MILHLHYHPRSGGGSENPNIAHGGTCPCRRPPCTPKNVGRLASKPQSRIEPCHTYPGRRAPRQLRPSIDAATGGSQAALPPALRPGWLLGGQDVNIAGESSERETRERNICCENARECECRGIWPNRQAGPPSRPAGSAAAASAARVPGCRGQTDTRLRLVVSGREVMFVVLCCVWPLVALDSHSDPSILLL